jgi:tRNA/tmRNA/rRNA uracil-C5-methylase (TrmA/RlmC/RlmD family)
MCPGRPEAHSEEIVELAIERIGARGDGVAQYRGEPVFVPFTVPGDRGNFLRLDIAEAKAKNRAGVTRNRASPDLRWRIEHPIRAHARGARRDLVPLVFRIGRFGEKY